VPVREVACFTPVYEALKRLLVGRPLPSAEQEHQRLPKMIALAVFSSDAISSTAYATEEILHVLVPLAALGALGHLVPISGIVIVLLTIVAISYIVTVLIPESVVRKWWQQLLHNQTALFLKGKLLFREGVVVTSVPYHLRAGQESLMGTRSR
jgi:hypothetical protein